jgi:hypothetical protein
VAPIIGVVIVGRRLIDRRPFGERIGHLAEPIGGVGPVTADETQEGDEQIAALRRDLDADLVEIFLPCRVGAADLHI